MKFYTLDGNEIDKSGFVEKYGNSYYKDCPRYIPRVVQNSRFVENHIDTLLKTEFKSRLMLFTF